MIGDDGVPFPSAASWVIRVIICIRECMFGSQDLDIITLTF